MSLDRNVSDAMDREVGGKIDRMEENRQEQWAERREDRDSIRGDIEGHDRIKEWDDPKPKRSMDDGPSEYNHLNQFGGSDGIRETAERMWDQSGFNELEREQREKEIADWDMLNMETKREFNLSANEALKRLRGAERILRDPEKREAGLRSVYHDYFETDIAQETEARLYENTTAEVVKIFEEYEIPEEIAPYVTEYMATPQFQASKTGDHKANVFRAYRMVTEGLKRARMPGGRR